MHTHTPTRIIHILIEEHFFLLLLMHIVVTHSLGISAIRQLLIGDFLGFLRVFFPSPTWSFQGLNLILLCFEALFWAAQKPPCVSHFENLQSEMLYVVVQWKYLGIGKLSIENLPWKNLWEIPEFGKWKFGQDPKVKLLEVLQDFELRKRSSWRIWAWRGFSRNVCRRLRRGKGADEDFYQMQACGCGIDGIITMQQPFFPVTTCRYASLSIQSVESKRKHSSLITGLVWIGIFMSTFCTATSNFLYFGLLLRWQQFVQKI